MSKETVKPEKQENFKFKINNFFTDCKHKEIDEEEILNLKHEDSIQKELEQSFMK